MSDPLDIMSQLDSVDLASVETSFPILDSGLVSIQISACEFKRDTDKKADAVPYLYIEGTLVAPHRTVSRDGELSKVVNPGDRGSKVIDRIYFGEYLDKKGDPAKYGYNQMAAFREAAYGKAAPGSKFSTIPQEMLGQTIQVVLKFEAAPKGKDGKEYGPRTSVERYVKAKVS